MKKLAMVAIAAALAGCQTRITIESDETRPLPIQQLVEENGTNRVITVGYYEGRPHYLITARSPLYAKESVARFAAGVGEGGTWTINADGYSRDLSTNAVTMVGEMFSGGAKLAIAIGDAYAKIAGGAQAETVLSSAQKVYDYFRARGGDVSRADVSVDETTKTLKVDDGTTCISCDADGNCSVCSP